MHNQSPIPLTPEEWDELAALREVRENWGLEPNERGAELALSAYGAKFDFMTGGPGYIGELFVLVGDGLSAPPMVFTRPDGVLRVAEF